MYRVGFEHLGEPYRSVVVRLLEELLKNYGGRLLSLVVYGSVARGDARRDSDIDLLIVIDGELPRSRLERVRSYLEAEEKLDPLLEGLLREGYAITISPIIKTRAEAERISPLYLYMVEDAVIVYDREGFFQGVLERLRKRLEELGAERVWAGRKWYWRLKKNYRFGEVIEL